MLYALRVSVVCSPYVHLENTFSQCFPSFVPSFLIFPTCLSTFFSFFPYFSSSFLPIDGIFCFPLYPQQGYGLHLHNLPAFSLYLCFLYPQLVELKYHVVVSFTYIFFGFPLRRLLIPTPYPIHLYLLLQ